MNKLEADIICIKMWPNKMIQNMSFWETKWINQLTVTLLSVLDCRQGASEACCGLVVALNRSNGFTNRPAALWRRNIFTLRGSQSRKHRKHMLCNAIIQSLWLSGHMQLLSSSSLVSSVADSLHAENILLAVDNLYVRHEWRFCGLAQKREKRSSSCLEVFK